MFGNFRLVHFPRARRSCVRSTATTKSMQLPKIRSSVKSASSATIHGRSIYCVSHATWVNALVFIAAKFEL